MTGSPQVPERAPAAEKREASKCLNAFILLLHLAVIGVVCWLSIGGGLNPEPNKSQHPDQCSEVLPNDNLSHLALRTQHEQVSQLARWEKCDPSTQRRARQTLPADDWQIAVIGVGLSLACVRCWRRPRWRLAAYFGMVLTGLYLAADSTENALLDHLL